MSQNKKTPERGFGFRSAKVRAMALDAAREAANIVLSSGELLRDFCDRNGINRLMGRKIFKKYGEGHLFRYIATGKKITSTEIKFIEIMREISELEILDKNPAGLEGCRKADFCVDFAGKNTYLITESLWDCSTDRIYYSKLHEMFKKNGKNLFMFYAHEIFDRPKIVKSLIKQYFKINPKIKITECEIRKIPSGAGEWFFKEHTLTPYCPKFLTYYAILNKGRIMACFAIRRRAGGELHIVLFGYSTGVYVTDAVKVFTYFLIKKYNPLKIIRFCNLRYETPDEFLSDGYVIEGIRSGGEWTEGEGFIENKTENSFKVYDLGRARLVKDCGVV